jgi:hypothetical protein
MKNLLIAISLLFAATMSAADYSGKWTLDKAQSRDLPPFYEHITSHALTITQDAKELDVAVTVSSDRHDPDHFDFHYKLDGTPAESESKIRTPNGPMTIPTTLTAKPNADGTLLITIDRKQMGTTTETWHLDGNKLIIDRTDEMPRGKFSSQMVFVRG